ncbi:MAG: BolA family transcriptional regulator [Herminiimonas sp.]|nr:BolA family transcriptional regulator [Herminiimonas sp.]
MTAPISEREQKILSLINATFAPTACLLEDESAQHAGHAGAASGGGHYRLRLVSSRFDGCNRVARHRLVYDCLDDMMRSEIHALAINALAPSEVTGQEYS